MTTIGVGSSAILILCFFHEESGKGLRIVEGLWKDCGGVVALCSLYLPPSSKRPGGGDVGGRTEGRGDYLKLAESLVRQQS